jgi:alkanesulfonate monooxygenase SsuD/methylene tetrahydromethanopterin reductase-like flavin-dependent oxidoreductase (luciferase family)
MRVVSHASDRTRHSPEMENSLLDGPLALRNHSGDDQQEAAVVTNVTGPMRTLGVYIFPWGPDRPGVEDLAALAMECEHYGFDSVHLPWHFTLPSRRMHATIGNRYILDPLLLLPVLAERTSRIRLGLNSALLPVHHPYVWAQHFASLDVITHGRVIPGAAIGWWAEDFQVGGVPARERGARSDEALEVINKLWAGIPIEAPGRFWDSRGLVLDPRPLQAPCPLWFGGSLKALDRAAKWATGLFMMNPTPAELRGEIVPAVSAARRRTGRPLDIVVYNYVIVSEDEHWLQSEVRPILRGRLNEMMPSELEAMPPGSQLLEPEGRVIWGPPERCAEQVERLFAAGANYMVLDFNFHGVKDMEYARHHLKRFAEDVVPRVGSVATR